MGTCNFYGVNAQSIYAILSTYEGEDENGNPTEVYKDEIDWDYDREEIQYHGENSGLFPFSSDKWNKELDAREVCGSEGKCEEYGKKKTAWTTQTSIDSVIVLRFGYYEHANLDYDVKICDCHGAEYFLSDYRGNYNKLIEDYVDDMEENVKWDGHDHGWTVGTFLMHRKNIVKWLTTWIEDEIEKCEQFCKDCCNTELGVAARFSNGETWYKKIG